MIVMYEEKMCWNRRTWVFINLTIRPRMHASCFVCTHISTPEYTQSDNTFSLFHSLCCYLVWGWKCHYVRSDNFYTEVITIHTWRNLNVSSVAKHPTVEETFHSEPKMSTSSLHHRSGIHQSSKESPLKALIVISVHWIFHDHFKPKWWTS